MKYHVFAERLNKVLERKIIDSSFVDEFSDYMISNCIEIEESPKLCQEEKETSFLNGILFQTASPEEIELERQLAEIKKLETFSDSLLRLIRERNKTAPEIYHAAGIDAKHFSKIISKIDYKPSKETVLAFAIALHLSIYETEELLKKVGFALSSTRMFDVAIKFFLERRYYDRIQIDIIMENLGLPLLPQNF